MKDAKSYRILIKGTGSSPGLLRIRYTIVCCSCRGTTCVPRKYLIRHRGLQRKIMVALIYRQVFSVGTGCRSHQELPHLPAKISLIYRIYKVWDAGLDCQSSAWFCARRCNYIGCYTGRCRAAQDGVSERGTTTRKRTILKRHAEAWLWLSAHSHSHTSNVCPKSKSALLRSNVPHLPCLHVTSNLLSFG